MCPCILEIHLISVRASNTVLSFLFWTLPWIGVVQVEPNFGPCNHLSVQKKGVPPIPNFWDDGHREERLDRGVYLDGEAAHGRSGSVFFVAKANTSVMPIPNSEDERYQTLQVQLAEYCRPSHQTITTISFFSSFSEKSPSNFINSFGRPKVGGLWPLRNKLTWIWAQTTF